MTRQHPRIVSIQIRLRVAASLAEARPSNLLHPHILHQHLKVPLLQVLLDPEGQCQVYSG